MPPSPRGPQPRIGCVVASVVAICPCGELVHVALTGTRRCPRCRAVWRIGYLSARRYEGGTPRIAVHFEEVAE